MKLGVLPENLAERLALCVGIPPPGIIESWLGIMATRAVMAATKLGIFETLAAGPLTVQEIATSCATHVRATKQLLNALAGMGCLTFKAERYALPRKMRAWVLADGKYSFCDQILLRYLEWRWWGPLRRVRAHRPTVAPARNDDSRRLGRLPARHALGH
jgi:hypothetical protein